VLCRGGKNRLLLLEEDGHVVIFLIGVTERGRKHSMSWQNGRRSGISGRYGSFVLSHTASISVTPAGY